MIGLIGKKKGMSALFDDKGINTPVTVLALGPCTVMEVKRRDTHSYDAVKIAFDPIADKRANQPTLGQFKKLGIAPHRVVREIRGATGEFQPGNVLTVDLFQPGDKIKVTGITKGRGFAGVIKRHHFGRPNQSHGTHESFRGSGSIGQHSYPARTWPGQRMAGRLGGTRVTVKNLKVMRVDTENGLLLVKGAVPGANGGLITVYKVA